MHAASCMVVVSILLLKHVPICISFVCLSCFLCEEHSLIFLPFNVGRAVDIWLWSGRSRVLLNEIECPDCPPLLIVCSSSCCYKASLCLTSRLASNNTIASPLRWLAPAGILSPNKPFFPRHVKLCLLHLRLLGVTP